MCGIIARMSIDTNPIKTIYGLKELEYRGYDSYGILFSSFKEESIVYKDIGEIDINFFNDKNIKSNIEIGHTRWATHGDVEKRNAHPHFDTNHNFFVVMNGIVENYQKIKINLTKEGVKFNSETDTEVIPQLFSYYFNPINKDLRKELILTMSKVIAELKGEFSFLLKYGDFLFAYKNMNPIIVGFLKNEVFISSDINLVMNNSEEYVIFSP